VVLITPGNDADWSGSLLNSANLMLQIITTVGYGDIEMTHHDDGMKIILSLYCLMCLAFAAKFLGMLGEWYVNGRMDEMKHMMRSLEVKAAGVGSHEEADAKYGKYNYVLVCFFQWLVPVIFGTIFYGLYERCSCSFGVSKIEGCVEDEGFDVCQKTGGEVKDFVTAFYMSMMTVTTIGFGDFTPKSRLGRLLAIPWITVGVVASASFIGALADFAARNRKTLIGAAQIDRATFDKIDVNRSGDLSLSEYRCFVLMSQGLVDEETMSQIDDAFKALCAMVDEDNPDRFAPKCTRLKWSQIRNVRRARSAEVLKNHQRELLQPLT